MITLWKRVGVRVNFAVPWTHNSNRGSSGEPGWATSSSGAGSSLHHGSLEEKKQTDQNNQQRLMPEFAQCISDHSSCPLSPFSSGIFEPANLLFNISIVMLYSQNTAISCVPGRDRHSKNKMRNYLYMLFCNLFPKCMICLSECF